MSELKPCPFCGSTVYLLDVATRYSMTELWDVYCANHQCYLSGGTNNMYETRQLAIEAWNSRAESQEIDTLREQVKVLRAALGKIANATIEGIDGDEWFNDIANIALEQTKSKDGE